MDADLRQLIEAIHQTNYRFVLALTGGGTGAAGMLLTVPGGSRTVLEIHVPYHEQALGDFLGHRPDQSCSVETVRTMACRALERAAWLSAGETVAGVACTASLATDRPKRGEHRCHVAFRSHLGHKTYSLTLAKGTRDRGGEEAIVNRLLLNTLAEASGIVNRVGLSLLPGEEVHCENLPDDNPLGMFLSGAIPYLCAEVGGKLSATTPLPALLLPGAFNPLHDGHRNLAFVAGQKTGLSPAFELSVLNVDKLSLTPEEIQNRLPQFTWLAPLWLTRAPTFADKALLFPGVIFVIGVDTASRIVAARYYNHNEDKMIDALRQLQRRGCSFLVAGRADHAGRFLGLKDLSIPQGLQELFQEIPESEFRADVSSSEIRGSSDS